MAAAAILINYEMIEVDVKSSVCRFEKGVSMTAHFTGNMEPFTIEVKTQQPH